MSINQELPCVDGTYEIKQGSNAMNHVLSVSYHETPAAGKMTINARPFGRTEFLPIEGASGLDITREFSINFAYPFSELQFVISGSSGGTVFYVVMEDGK